MQKEGYKGLTGFRRGKPCKKNEGKRQKIDVKPCPSRRKREKFEKLLKSEFEQVKISFKKHFIHNFRLIEILGLIDRNKRRLT